MKLFLDHPDTPNRFTRYGGTCMPVNNPLSGRIDNDPKPINEPTPPEPNDIFILYKGQVIAIISPRNLNDNIVTLSNEVLLTILTLILTGDN